MEMNWKQLLLISASLKTGLLQSLADESQSAQELSAKNDFSLRAVEITLDALKEIGLLEKNESKYKTSEKALPFVDENHPEYMANALLHNARLVENWTKLDEAIITGKSQTRRRNEGELEIFARSMDEFSRSQAPEIINLTLGEMPSAKNVLDVGGALGTHSKLFAKKGLEVTLLDTEAITELSKKFLKDKNINIVSQNFTEGLPSGPFDIILLSNVTHIYKGQKIEQIFNLAKSSLAANGIIAILDYVKDKSPGAAMFAVNMLVHTAGGGTWTIEQYDMWLKASNLNLTKILDLKLGEQKLLIAKNNQGS